MCSVISIHNAAGARYVCTLIFTVLLFFLTQTAFCRGYKIRDTFLMYSCTEENTDGMQLQVQNYTMLPNRAGCWILPHCHETSHTNIKYRDIWVLKKGQLKTANWTAPNWSTQQVCILPCYLQTMEHSQSLRVNLRRWQCKTHTLHFLLNVSPSHQFFDFLNILRCIYTMSIVVHFDHLQLRTVNTNGIQRSWI